MDMSPSLARLVTLMLKLFFLIKQNIMCHKFAGESKSGMCKTHEIAIIMLVCTEER